MTHTTRPLTRKPGEFRAVCRSGSWQPLDAIDHDLRTEIEGSPDWATRWDRSLECEVAAVPCTLDTTDRKAFEQHMADVHGVKSSALLMNKNRGYAAWPTPSALSRPWKAPKLTEDGVPFKHTGETRECRGCGLVIELGAGSAAFIEEHKASCAERGAA